MAIQYRIQEMQGPDLDAVTALEAECFSMPWKYHDFKEVLANPNRIYLMAVLDTQDSQKTEIIGGCMLTDLVGEGDISNVAVRKSYRGNHVATALLQELMTIGETTRGICTFTLEVRSKNIAAIRLYEKLGFISLGIRPNFYDKPKDDALIMKKTCPKTLCSPGEGINIKERQGDYNT